MGKRDRWREMRDLRERDDQERGEESGKRETDG